MERNKGSPLKSLFSLFKTQKYWVAGFIEGEGSTNISFKKQKNMKIRKGKKNVVFFLPRSGPIRPYPSFSVTQHWEKV
jgi:hypothetical protein